MAKFSDDIIKQIQDAIDRRGEVAGSLDELNKIAATVVDKYNRASHDDFEGLSPHQMYILLNKPFSPECFIKLETSGGPDLALKSPVIRICMVIIDGIKANNGLTLTKKGNLPRKIVSAICDLNINSQYDISDQNDRTLNELDYAPAAITNALMKLSGLVINRKNKLQLTKTGESIAGKPILLFKNLFTAFTTNFNKGYLDRYESDGIGNLGTLYTVYLLNKFGMKRREASFYAGLYFKAFPKLIDEISFHPFLKPEVMAYSCFIFRTFEKGLFLFGLVEIEYEGKDYLNRKIYIKTSDIFRQIVKIT
ncbi:MAG: hypothetical protein WCE64_02020 [Bacteroidales bacterium]